jgi:hypothetical protein
MVLCCLIPIVLLGIIWYFGISSSTLTAFIPLLCPILMFVGMALMMRHKHDDKTTPDETKSSGPAGGDDGHQGHCDK